MEAKRKEKKWFSFSNITTALLIFFAVGMFVFPEFKATVLKGLMQVGLFRPDTSPKPNNNPVNKKWDVQFINSKNEIVGESALHNKVVFINVWATWCPPCIAEMPSINELYKTLKNDDVVFVMLDADNDLQKAEKFMVDKGFELPVFRSGSSLPEEWYSGTLPTTVVIDKTGNIAFQHAGVANYNTGDFKKFIEQLAAK